MAAANNVRLTVMNIDRYMVNLFFEIKRNIPTSQQTNMNISNPQLGKLMSDLYCQTDDENIKLLTQIFLERAGENWLKDAKKGAPSTAQRLTKRFNKATVNKPANSSESKIKVKPKRIYRGQVVEE
jgi:hypothetical protein